MIKVNKNRLYIIFELGIFDMFYGYIYITFALLFLFAIMCLINLIIKNEEPKWVYKEKLKILNKIHDYMTKGVFKAKSELLENDFYKCFERNEFIKDLNYNSRDFRLKIHKYMLEKEVIWNVL